MASLAIHTNVQEEELPLIHSEGRCIWQIELPTSSLCILDAIPRILSGPWLDELGVTSCGGLQTELKLRLADPKANVHLDEKSAIMLRVLRHDGDVKLRQRLQSYNTCIHHRGYCNGDGRGVAEGLRVSHWLITANVCALAIDGSKRVVGLNFLDTMWDHDCI